MIKKLIKPKILKLFITFKMFGKTKIYKSNCKSSTNKNLVERNKGIFPKLYNIIEFSGNI